ncbi:MAG: hypothetical protein ACYDBQ_05550 [Thermoplasmatota archaeon]
MRAALVILLAVALPVVGAPLPPAPPTTLPNPAGGGLALVLSGSSQVTVAVDHPATLYLNVTNLATPSNTPLDQARTLTVGISVAGLPDSGWSASVVPATVVLAPQSRMEVLVTLAVQPEAGASADLEVTAAATSDPSNPAGPPPSSTVGLHADRNDGFTRTLLDRLGPGVYVLLALVPLLLLVVAVVAVRRRGGAVTLEAAVRDSTVPPGGRVSFPLSIHNLGRRAQPVLLQAPNAEGGWTTVIPDPEVEVPARGSSPAQLVLVAPPAAALGSVARVTLTAFGAEDPRHPASLAFQATVRSRR